MPEHRIEPARPRRTHVRRALLGALAGSATLALGLTGLPPLLASGPLCVTPSPSSTCFSHIQDAVNAASTGATIQVAPGTYHETVSITKPLTLQGASGNLSIIDATGKSNAIQISSTSYVKVSGLGATNANFQGILVQDSNNITLDRDSVRNNDKSLDLSNPSSPSCPGLANPLDQDDCGEGINLVDVAYSTVSASQVQGNAGGILLSDETGPTHDNTIFQNTVQDNLYDCGITIPSHAAGVGHGVYDNTVDHNIITGNGTHAPGGAGIGMFTPFPGTASYDNTISNNIVTGNGIGGVVLHSHAPGQNLNGNQILKNTIHDNGALGDGDSGVNNAGIIVFSAGGSGANPITGMVISGNTISNEQIDVWVGTGNATDPTINGNNLLNSSRPGGPLAIGVKNTGTSTLDATQNYWGCPTGPGTPGCSTVSGSVNFTPFSPRFVSP